jgi:ubiquinone/menaquinone biosynthesis C-methylase UbiE
MNLQLTNSIRDSYNLLANEYATHLFGELHNKPLDRELLDRFASEVKGRGEVCDMGCGPGQVARYLHQAGVTVFGLDLSPGMLEQARTLNAGIRFREGNMLALELGDQVLVGITAFYAIVNLPEGSLPLVFQEMQRVLQPGGLLLLAFHTGDEVVRVQEMWGQPVALEFFFFQPSAVRRHLEAAGFEVERIIEREPYAPAVEHQSQRAYIFARRLENDRQALASW